MPSSPRVVRSRGVPPTAFRLTHLAAASAMLVGGAGWAQAQDAGGAAAQKPEAEKIETVVVTGIRRGIESSVTAKRNADQIIEVVSAEDIGKLPDASVAESLARLPGLTGQRGPDGRVDVISIRGLNPAFSGALLNGREVVSSNDSRAVEYDQFPSELVGQAIIYKTPDATLIGGGLSGTVDIRSLRPLEFQGRQIVVNLRGDHNTNKVNVPGVAPEIGTRFSASYVDQFMDRKLGVALGFAHLDSASQTRQTELVQFGDYTPFGLPVTGNVPATHTYHDGGGDHQGQAMLPMFWTATSSSKRNLRDGLMATVEYKPDDAWAHRADLFYSHFDQHEVSGKFLSSLFATWGGGVTPNLSDIQTTEVGNNTYVTSATADKMPVTTGNMDTRRRDEIYAVGLNSEWKFAPTWKATSDISASRNVRDERYQEVYAAPFDNATQSWIYGSFKWHVPVNGGAQSWTPLVPNYLSDPGIVKLGDQGGFDFVPDTIQPAYTGAIRTPHIVDEIKGLRLTLAKDFEGAISRLQFGANYTQRDKVDNKNETRLLLRKDEDGHYIRDVPASALGTPFDMSWAGVPSLIRIDVPTLVSTGAVDTQNVYSMLSANNTGVHEKISTAFARLDYDDTVGGVALKGNAGLQVVHAQQSATGWEYFGDEINPDPNLLYAKHGGASYADVLPTLNASADFGRGWIVRAGLAKAIARPDMVAMRAGCTMAQPNADRNEDGEPGPNFGKWSTAVCGNPQLRPWRTNAMDLSLEKYFGKRSYVSVAAFRKNLLTYVSDITTQKDTTYIPIYTIDKLTGQPVSRDLVDSTGPVLMPSNGKGGAIWGTELAASLEGSLLTPMLDGFGVIASYTTLGSTLREPGGSRKVNGLSGMSNGLTVYYEKEGFSARVSQRYRSPFTATVRDIYFNSTTRQQDSDQVVDVQLDYAFETGPLKGLSLLAQANNVLDRQTVNKVSVGPNAPDPSQLLPNYIYRYGTTYLLGMQYKF